MLCSLKAPYTLANQARGSLTALLARATGSGISWDPWQGEKTDAGGCCMKLQCLYKEMPVDVLI
jgi:hypothetical protein